MKNYVISLAQNNENRRQHIKEEFAKKHIPFTFFDAVTATTIEARKALLGITLPPTEISQPEIACFLSHYALWHKIATENIPYAAIFEDDIYLAPESAYFLNNDTWIPKNTDIIKIEKFDDYYYPQDNPILLKNNFTLQRFRKNNWGAAGYILANSGAKHLLSTYQNSKQLLIADEFMFCQPDIQKNYYIYQLNPALCIQDKILNKEHVQYSSELDFYNQQRKSQKQKAKISLLKKIKREIMRAIDRQRRKKIHFSR